MAPNTGNQNSAAGQNPKQRDSENVGEVWRNRHSWLPEADSVMIPVTCTSSGSLISKRDKEAKLKKLEERYAFLEEKLLAKELGTHNGRGPIPGHIYEEDGDSQSRDSQEEEIEDSPVENIPTATILRRTL